MPLTERPRLDRLARDKIKALLRALYNHWLAQGVPDRLAATVRDERPRAAAASGDHQPSADRRVH